MKISFKQKIKNLVAIILIILSMLIIKNNLNKKISNIQSITNDISIVKVKSGSSIYEKKLDELNLITTAKNKLLLNQNIKHG